MTAQASVGSFRDFRLEVDDGGLLRALREAPVSVAFHFRRAMQRIANEAKRGMVAQQQTPAFKRLVRRSIVIIGRPRTARLSTVRGFVGARGVGELEVAMISFSKALGAHERGVTVRKGPPGMPVVVRPRAFSAELRSLRKEAPREPFREGARLLALLRREGRDLVPIRTAGRLTIFERRGRGRPRRDGTRQSRLVPVVSFLGSVTIDPALRIVSFWDGPGAAVRGKHLRVAIEGVARRLGRRERRSAGRREAIR